MAHCPVAVDIAFRSGLCFCVSFLGRADSFFSSDWARDRMVPVCAVRISPGLYQASPQATRKAASREISACCHALSQDEGTQSSCGAFSLVVTPSDPFSPAKNSIQ